MIRHPLVLCFALAVGAVLAACAGGTDAPQDLPTLPPRTDAADLPAAGVPVVQKRVTLAWTGEVRGEIEVCGCPTVPYGGFERRGDYISQLQAQGDPVFVLDAGEMLIKGAKGVRADDQALRAQTVLELSRQVGLDAWAPGPSDLRVQSAWPDAVAVNLEGFAPTAVLERGGVRIGVVGVSGTAPGKVLDETELVASVRSAIAKVTAPVDGWVLLSNASSSINRRLAEGVPELGIVLGTRGEDLDAPTLTSGAPIVEAPDRGRFVSVVRWSIGTVPGPAALVNGGRNARNWEAWDDALERLVLQTGPARVAEQGRVESLWGALAPEAAGRNLVLVRDRPLGSDLHGETKISDAVKQFQDASIGAAKSRVAQDQAVRYVSAGSCTGCHNDYVAAWAATPSHPQAWQALIARKATDNPECIGCHSTAWGEPGGNASADDVAMRTWKAVQCEECHGPMSAHRDDPRRNHGAAVTEATCLACHDEANSPTFNYESYRKRLSCVSLKQNEGNPEAHKAVIGAPASQ
jgi:hypothetical protein